MKVMTIGQLLSRKVGPGTRLLGVLALGAIVLAATPSNAQMERPTPANFVNAPIPSPRWSANRARIPHQAGPPLRNGGTRYNASGRVGASVGDGENGQHRPY